MLSVYLVVATDMSNCQLKKDV